MNQVASIPAAKTALEAPTDQSLRVPCYCEENVWRLAYRKIRGDKKKSGENLQYHVVFVTNPTKCVPMFQQLASKNPSKPCLWDYHVILICTSSQDKNATTTSVLDIDSHLPHPSTLNEYLSQVFLPELCWPEEYQPYFRVIDASRFLGNFSSDRMHMFKAETKEWLSPPPTYECITNTQESNLVKYMTITENDINNQATNGEDDPFGVIYSLPQLQARFGVK